MGLYFVAYEMRGPRRIALDELEAATAQAESSSQPETLAVPEIGKRNDEAGIIDAVAASGYHAATGAAYESAR